MGRQTEKQRLIERLTKAGVKGVDSMTQVQLQRELKRIKSEGVKVEDLRVNNSAPKSLAGSTALIEARKQHVNEEVEIQILDRSKPGNIRIEKRTRLVAILDMLAQSALKDKDVSAAKEYLDRTIGKTKQEIEHSGEIKVEEQRLPTKAEKAAAEAYLKALEDDE